MNVLIVDDDSVDREFIKRILKQGMLQCKTYEALTVDEGIEVFKQHDFDIVLLDYSMPKRNGIEMVIEIRGEFKESRAAIVMMSTSADEDLALKCLKAGAQDYLVKSDIKVSQLRRAILNAQTRYELELEVSKSYQRVKYLAERDNLTGLPNRYFFNEAMRMAIAKNSRRPYKFALLLIDIDHFKYINDTYGHHAGDELLVSSVKRITSCLRGDEVFARLGGDEFGIIVSEIPNAKTAGLVAERILRLLKKPFGLDNAHTVVSASIGISVFPETGTSSDELLKQADIAMYRAKKLGRDQFSYFEAGMQEVLDERFKTERDLRRALKEKCFELFYQPIVDQRASEVVGYEALIRCRIDKKLLPPNVFIPIAEESKLIIDIGKWVICEAIRQISLWNKDRSTPLSISINLSPVQFADSELPGFIAACLKENGVRPSSVYLEITETALLDHSRDNISMIEKIVTLGCNIALDDFGTGFSSITHLMNFPINTVKIDRSLMPMGQGDERKNLLLKGLVSMLQHMRLEIVGEGVETVAHRDLCCELGIEKLQGFLYSKPMNAKDVEDSEFGPNSAAGLIGG